MKITNLGGATAIIEQNGKRMLFDPWLDEGIFHGAWHHYPPLRVSLDEIGRFDYVYISHIHEDHCSLKTLQKINSDAEIIIMDRKPNFVLNFLNANQLKFKKIHLIPEKTPTKIDDLQVDMLTADPEHELNYLIDSMLILKWGNQVLLNANDCPLHEDAFQYLEKQYEKIDLALLPYAGGSGYPSCYLNLDDAQKTAEMNRIRQSGLNSFFDAMKRIKPKRAMPFADQYVVVGSRAHLNRYMAHPPGPGALLDHPEYSDLKDKVLLLNSGQSFDLDREEKAPKDSYQIFTEQDRDQYIHDHSQGVVYDHEKIHFDRSVPFDRLVEYSRARLWSEQERRNYFIDFRYYIDIGEEKLYEIDLKKKEIVKIDHHKKIQPYLTLKGSRDLMIMMMMGHISWNIADAALFIDYDRVPNQYNTIVHALINFLRI